MRRIQSLFKTLLMLIPMTAVPMMAIFGIPEFFPVSASPSTRTSDSGQILERRVGQSDSLLVRSLTTSKPPSIDLFQPYDTSDQSLRTPSGDVVANASSSEMSRRRLAWRDPLSNSQNTRTEVSIRTTSTSTPPENRVQNSKPSAAPSRNRGVAESFTHNEPSFSGQAAISPQVASSRTANFQTANVASEDIRSDGSVTGRYSRLMHGGHENSVESHLVPSAKTEMLTWQQAVDRLNQLGIRTFRLTQDSSQNSYRFVCLVTSIDDPRISRRFEADSIYPLVAVADVLAQVENWNLHQ